MRTAVLLVAAVLPLAAQPKLLVNAKVETRDGSAGLRQAFDAASSIQPQPAWIGYTVAAAPSRNLGCDSWMQDDGFRSGGGTVHLEPAAEALVLFRIVGNRVDRIRVMAPDCNIDAGGVPFHWLTGVRPGESVALLRSLGSEQAVAAIAAHGGPEADTALEEYAAPGQPEAMRARAASWLGGRGDRGVAAVRKIVAEDPSEKVRGRAVGSLRLIPANGGVPILIELASGTGKPDVRKQAMFWLGHSKDPRAIAFFEQVLKR